MVAGPFHCPPLTISLFIEHRQRCNGETTTLCWIQPQNRQCQWAWWVCGSVVSERGSLFSQPHHTCTALCDVSKWTWSAPCFWWQQQSARPLHVTASACCTVADFSQPRVYFSPNRHPELFIHNPLCADALIINCSADCGSCKNC